MLRVSPLALGPCASAPLGASRVRLAATSRMRLATATAISSRLLRPLTADLCAVAYRVGRGRQTGRWSLEGARMVARLKQRPPVSYRGLSPVSSQPHTPWRIADFTHAQLLG